MEYLAIGLAALTAAVGAALVFKAIQLVKQFAETQERIVRLEQQIKEIAEREVVPALDAAQALSQRVDRLMPPKREPEVDVASAVDGWADYLPKLVEIVSKFSESAPPRESSRSSDKGVEG
jgi:hypothetical protein